MRYAMGSFLFTNATYALLCYTVNASCLPMLYFRLTLASKLVLS